MSEQYQSKITDSDLQDVRELIAENRTPLIIIGIVLIVIGGFALGYPFATTLVVKAFVGWVLLISGVAQVVFAFSTGKWSSFFLDLLIGAVSIFAGAWLAFFPLAGIISLTLLVALTFLAQGIAGTAIALRLRPMQGWGWMLLASIFTIIVSIVIFMKLPGSAAWVIGVLVGANLLITGIAYVAVGITAGK